MADCPVNTEAAVLVELERPLRLMELRLPELKAGQVLVEMAYSGVCHSQLNEARGLKGVDRFLPHTLGHEGSGTVRAVGPSVTKVKVGDPVILSWIKSTGTDVPSTTYRSADGIVNSGAISTFMHHTVTCETRVTVIPEAMPLRQAALLGCAIPTGCGLIWNTACVQPGSSVAVFGVGGVGLSAVMGAELANATTIIAVDISERALEKARQLGATHLISARQEDALAGIARIVGGAGVDYAIEAAGRRETAEMAFQAVRDEGGLCVLAGNLPQGQTIAIDPFGLIKGKRVVGTWGGSTVVERDIPRYVSLYLSGKLNLDALIGREYTLAEVNLAMEDLRGGAAGRLLIRFGADGH